MVCNRMSNKINHGHPTSGLSNITVRDVTRLSTLHHAKICLVAYFSFVPHATHIDGIFITTPNSLRTARSERVRAKGRGVRVGWRLTCALRLVPTHPPTLALTHSLTHSLSTCPPTHLFRQHDDRQTRITGRGCVPCRSGGWMREWVSD